MRKLGFSSQSAILGIFLLSLLTFTPAAATVYYVSTTGDNAADGLTVATAWLTIDNGDVKGLLLPGDTVYVLPGTYQRVGTTVLFTASGTAAEPIVYLRHGNSRPVINLGNAGRTGITMSGKHTIIDGLVVTTSKDGIVLTADSCEVRHCLIHNVAGNGIKVQSSDNLFYRNVIYNAGDRGIKNEDAGELRNRYFHNVISSCDAHGLELGSKAETARIFNNIIVQNGEDGIKGPSEAVCGFNNVWGNLGDDYGGVEDSAGGISKAPRFVNASGLRFDLQDNAHEIDAGLDLGYHFNGPAPDMGAFEKFNVYYVSPAGDDSASGRSPQVAWRTIDNGDSLLLPGDTVHVLAGIYSDSVSLISSGFDISDVITIAGIPESTFINAAAFGHGMTIAGAYVTISGIGVLGATADNFAISGTGVRLDECMILDAGEYGVRATVPVTIQKCVISGNGTAGVYCTGGTGSTVYNNTFYQNGAFGFTSDGVGATLVNNIFVGHTTAAIRADATSSATYSLFYDNAFAVQGGVAAGYGSISADPHLVDPSGGDYRIESHSPAIDAGTDVGLPYVGPAPDLGVYEANDAVTLLVGPIVDSLSADSSYEFTVFGYDADGYPARTGPIGWSHTFSDGSINSTGLFTPQSVGSGSIIAVASEVGLVDTSAVMTVVPGALSGLLVSPLRDTISTDTTLQFSAVGVDVRGNLLPSAGTLTWQVWGGIGNIDVSGLFSPTTTGKGVIRVASSLGVSAQSDTIVVVPGALASLQVLPEQNIQGHSESFQYHAYGYDAHDNLITEMTDSVTWTDTDPSGSVNASGIYTSNPLLDGTFYVKATFGGLSDSAEVIVTDQLSNVRIELADGTPLGDTALSTDVDNTRLYCRAYTVTSVLIGDVAVNWEVIGTDSIGHPSTNFGTSAMLVLTAPGVGQVIVSDSLGRADTSGVITCTAGAPDHFVILPATDTVSADSTLTFSCQSLDADGNSSNPAVVPNWFVLGGIGTITSGGVFTPSTTGTGWIVCLGGGIADTVGPIVVVAGELSQIAIVPDSAVVSADAGRQFTVVALDSHGNATDAGTITWGLTVPLGTISAGGYFDAVTTGTGRVTAVSSLGPVDTSAYLQVLAGRVDQIIVTPDSVATTTDSIITFSAMGYDQDGNTTSPGQLDWAVIGTIGDISSGGVFTPLVAGTGQIVAINEVEDIADTNAIVTVAPGELARLAVAPDTATMRVGDSREFSATGYDATFNITDIGPLTWSVTGGIGSVDDSGLFTAQAPGRGRVVAYSELHDVRDSSGTITIEALTVSTIPLGTFSVLPGNTTGILAFRIANDFSNDKQIQDITVHTAFKGPGSQSQRRSNLSGIALYLDRDADSVLSAGDSLVVETALSDSSVNFSFAPLTIAGGSGLDFLVAAQVSLAARDADTLDLFMRPSSDVTTVDGTTVVGPDPANSLGYTIIDGMVAAQIGVTSSGIAALVPGDTIYNVLTVDLPRNGYAADTLSTISLLNIGTAAPADLTQMTLYADNGDGIWNGAGSEITLGNLGYTGALWVRSGLAYPLTALSTRFYVGVRLADFPTGGATVALAIPTGGITVRSNNDGPIDVAVDPIDTIPIETFESVTVTPAVISSRALVPGKATGPMLGLTLASSYGAAVGIDSLKLNLLAADPHGATAVQLSSQVDSVLLYLNRDQNFASFGSADSLVAVGTVANGVVTFIPTGLVIPGGGGSMELSVGLHLTSLARNGNTLALVLSDSTDLYWNRIVEIDGTFPAGNTGTFTVDAFSASRVTVNSVSGATLFGGQANTVVLDFVLPPNGYSLDSLKTLRIRNAGTFVGTADVLTFKLWAERTVDGLTAGDTLLGTFVPSNGQWTLDGLRYPIGSSGQRLYVTVSVAAVTFNAGTVRMQVPIDGVLYRSGTEGPDDLAVENPNVHLIVPSNRITAISVPTASAPVAPGAEGNPVLTFALYNGYVGHDQTLKAAALTNISRSLSGPDYADYEFGQVSLYYDSDNNRALGNDSLVAVGTFSEGRLSMSGLDVLLPAESLTYFFVVADIRLDAIDADSLAVAVSGPGDFVFSEPVSVNGDLPLTNGGYLIVDGSVRAQYHILPQAPRTLSPLDSGVTLLAFQPAVNGDRTDVLQSVTINNAGTATSTDFDQVALWLDRNADHVWQAGDSLLGNMTYSGGGWTLNGLQVSITQPPPVLLVVADIAAGATSDASFRGRIPVNGCIYSSANDGPRDSALTDANVYTISNSPLQVAYEPLHEAYSVGQTIAVSFTVRNAGDSTITGVTGAVVGIADSSLVAPIGSAPAPVTLGAGESTLFTFEYVASAVGAESWQLAALSAVDTSSVISTNTTTLQQPPSLARARLINSIPTAVTRGQENVFPLSLVFTHPDTALATAALRLDSLVLTVENGAGAGVSAADVFRRLVLATGTATLTVIEDVPTGSAVTVHFSQPLLVLPGSEQRLSVLVDIDSTAAATQFALAVSAGTALPFLDANSGDPLTVVSPIGFPMRTAPCRIDDPSQHLAVSCKTFAIEAVNLGQRDVPLVQLNFRHPGLSGSSQIQLSELTMEFVDAAATSLWFGDVFDEVKIVRQQTTVGSVTYVSPDSQIVDITLSSPLTFNAGDRDSLRVLATIRNDVAASEFALLIADSTAFVVRDHSSGSELTATTDTSGLATGATIFPIQTDWIQFHRQAAPPQTCLSATLPVSIVGGADSLGLFDLAFSYPFDPDFSSVRVTTVAVSVLDSTGSPLDPNRLFDRLGCRIDGGSVRYQTYVDLLSGAALFRLTDTGVVLNPGETITVSLIADIEADAPYDHFVLQIPSENSLRLYDMTDTTHLPLLSPDGGCGISFPFATSTTEVLFPAGRPSFSPQHRPVQVVFAGQTDIPVLQATLSYASSTPQGSLGLEGLVGRVRQNTGIGSAAGSAASLFASARLFINGYEAPGQVTLSGDSLALHLTDNYRISRNDMLNLELVVTLADNAPVGNYFLQFGDSTFLQVCDLNTLAAVYTGLGGAVYPLLSTELSVAALGLESSFSNFPNPFNPAVDGPTKIAYVLDRDATIDIEIFSITGEAVREVVMNATRSAGPHQEDTWEGVNGAGRAVLPGTYFCRITARYADGEEESFRRKIAVVR